MEDVLDRLWELSEDGVVVSAAGTHMEPALLTEAQHLWQTLETLTATQKAVHDTTFSKMLACIHNVLKTPALWTVSTTSVASGANSKSVLELASRVLVKLGCRGEAERDVILREGSAALLVQTVLGSDAPRLTSGEMVALLHVLQTLAFDTQHRIDLLQCESIPATLEIMRRCPNELTVQVFGCKFLQFMAYEEAAKEVIIQHRGIEGVLKALDSFASDAQLATSASDMLYFLSLDLESAYASQESQFVFMTQAIMDHIIQLMRTHRQVRPVQVHGIAILLTFAGAHASARRYLSDHGASASLWDVVSVAVVTNDDATADTIDLLERILETPDCYETIQCNLLANNKRKDASAQLRALHSLPTLISCLESKRTRPQYAKKARAMAFVIDRTQTLIQRTKTQPLSSVTSHMVDEDEIQIPPHLGALQVESHRPNRAVTLLFHKDNDDACDGSHRILDSKLSPTKERDSPYGYFDEFVRDGEDSRGEEENESIVDQFTSGKHNEARHGSRTDRPPMAHCSVQDNGTTNWQNECEKAKGGYRDLEGEYQLLQDNYQMLLRRAQEQSKLLNIQNARIQHHTHIHQQVLTRVKTLETALGDAQRKHQVERELRLAEVAQAEKISLALHEAMKEITALSKHNSTATRELQQKEKLRVDYQQKASAARQQQQQLEDERDDAVIQMRSMRHAQVALSQRLYESRREADEALRMREEDVDSPKLSAFSEMLSLSPSARLRKVSSYTLTTKRVAAEASERQLRQQEQRKSMYAGAINRVVRPVDASILRKASLYGNDILVDRSNDRSNRSVNMMVVDGEVQEEDHDEYRMEPPKDGDRSTGLGAYVSPQRGLDKFEIERTLRAVYDAFDKSPESTGVHVATIRRFFGDCGIVQPPLVAGDVDTILTRVINQAQENRKRLMVRKDFTVSTIVPGGIGSSSSQQRATEVKRFRFFDEEAFFEAVTLLVLRRFPRLDAKEALQVFITDYLHPMQRQMQQQQLLQQRRSSTSTSCSTGGLASTYRTTTRSGSMTSGASGNTSPTAACIGILRTVLNGLALHTSRDDQPLCPTTQDSIATTIRQSSDHHARKPKREDVVYSMLEMHAVLAREYKPLATLCEFYSAMHHTPRDVLLRDDGLAMPLTFDLLLTFAMDFEIIPSFMDRLSLKHVHSEVSGFLKTYLTLQKKLPPPHAMDTEMLKKVAFSMVLARLAMDLFSARREYETPEKQITALLQWLDNSVGREKIQKKAMLPIVIKFSRKLYALRA